MLVDYEAVVLGLKGHIRSKRSHGQDELLAVLADLEVTHRLPEEQGGFDDRPLPDTKRSSRPNGKPAQVHA